MSFYRNSGKRGFDFTIALLAVIVTAPILVGLAFLVLLDLGLPVLFRQQRSGFNSIPFVLLKFRTMKSPSNAPGRTTLDRERLTTLGRFLRRTSLDELPELLNVIKGEMSLVGPRPLLVHYLPRYSQEQLRRHEARPGITGWAQVNGRNAIAWEDKFKFDVWYIANLSFGLDLRIIALTIWKSLKREGINQPGRPTVDEFLGDQTDR